MAFDKYSFIRRQRQELAYGHLAAERLRTFSPDAVLASNLPLDPLRLLQLASRTVQARFYVWLQDIYSAAMIRILPQRLPIVGHVVARRYQSLERRILREASGVICITDDFLTQLRSWSLPAQACYVIENWAPLDEIKPMSVNNSWAAEHGLLGKRVLLYSGTLSLKHNPSLFIDLCRTAAEYPDVVVVVISEGLGADWLARAQSEHCLSNLVLLSFQPYSRFSEVLASATILLALIEADAGIYSVPSKVLSYLCAGRPILLSVPFENLAARTILRAQAGIVVRPSDRLGLQQSLRDLLERTSDTTALARSGRS